MNRSTDRCWAEIDRSALCDNVKVVRDRIGAADLLAVVKANAYGHGLVGVAKALANDAQLFGVANLEEAIQLRAALPHPIMILGPALPEETSTIAERGFIPTISTFEEAEEFGRVARDGAIPINFKIDTGMGRMGVPEGDALSVFKKVSALPKIKIHSISTHLPASNEDAAYTRDELQRFVYGISPMPEFQKLLKPAMTWKTRIVLVRDMPKGSSISYGRTFIAPRKMRIATLSAGYADGYPWHVSNRNATVLVRGRRCALVGRVTMDLMMIDVSKIDNVQVGNGVVLMGRDGNEEISCAELAERAGTIAWEIITRIGSRVRRVFV